MGLIDPMVISNAAAGGVIAFDTGPVLWAVTMTLLAFAATATVLAGRPFRSRPSVSVTSLPPPLRLATAGAAK